MSETEITGNICAVCGITAVQRCTGCLAVTYCGKEHQVQDWKRGHKNVCKAYEVVVNDDLGRYCIATKNIKKGDVLLREKPSIIGPKTVTPAICLTCHKFMMPAPGESNFTLCSLCRWPMCSYICESSPLHKDECELFVRKKFDPNIKFSKLGKVESNYCSIMALRMLMLKEKDPKLYKKLMTLESHLDQRRNTSLYQLLGMNLPMCLKMLLGREKVDRETALNLCGIFDTNCFDVKVPGAKVNARGIYFEAAMFSHSCRPNARHLFKPNYDIVIFATTDIKKGDIISLSYTQPLKCTLERRLHLKEAKCFDCFCERCKDPTEFGLYMNSILCTSCQTGKLVQIAPETDIESDFKCDTCEATFDIEDVKETKKTIQDAIKGADKSSPDDFEAILEMYKNTFPPNASAFLEIKYALLQLYGNPNDLSPEKLQRKIDLCVELLEISKILDPDYGALRTTLLKELQACLIVFFKTAEETKEYKELYEEAVNIKQFEEKLIK
ncbi:SET domain-containing protein SmydA-8-like [Culicoides brevitarsis]|uniref:SET domain-containing protein SmydA-8-like n=1 Tax=Culicoides brevitarsis TaxID=469753 RepID=UPI00307C8610